MRYFFLIAVFTYSLVLASSTDSTTDPVNEVKLASPEQLVDLKKALTGETLWQTTSDLILGDALIPFDWDLIGTLGSEDHLLPQLKYLFKHMLMTVEEQYEFIDGWTEMVYNECEPSRAVMNVYIDAIDPALPVDPKRSPGYLSLACHSSRKYIFSKLTRNDYFLQWILSDLTGGYSISSYESLAHGIWDQSLIRYLASVGSIDIHDCHGKTPMQHAFETFFTYKSDHPDGDNSIYLNSALWYLQYGANFWTPCKVGERTITPFEWLCEQDHELEALMLEALAGYKTLVAISNDQEYRLCQLPFEVRDTILWNAFQNLISELIRLIKAKCLPAKA